jgi:pyridoxal phosphate enzyme (YggS family)
MSTAAERLAEVRGRIETACRRAGRDPAGVELVAVSKTFPPEAVRELAEAGQRVFGESRQQEAEAKIPLLPAGLCWHFIGHLQRNKVRKVLPLCDTIHSVDSLRLARHIDEVAGELGLEPRVYLEVNLAGEESKHGYRPADLRRELPELLGLRRLGILGLMAVPPAAEDPQASRRWFAELRTLRDELAAGAGAPLDGLSMGMSGDYEVAVEEGATAVRVGSALFGARVG